MSTPSSSSTSFVTHNSSHIEISPLGSFPYGGFGSSGQEVPSSALNVPGNGAISPLISSPMDNLANGSVNMTNQTMTLPVAVDVRNTPFHHLCPEQFHFITSKPTYAASHRLISLPMLNHMMTTKEWREEYGSQPSLSKFIRDWKPFGVVKDPISSVQFAKNTDLKFQDPGFTLRLVIGGRVRMTQINQAMELSSMQQGAVKKGDKLYIYATRHVWSDSHSDLIFNKEEFDKKFKESITTDTSKAAVHKPSTNKTFNKITENNPFKNYPNDHYWVFRPWISSDNKPPPFNLWTGIDEVNDNKRWAGCVIYIGKIDHVHGKRQNDKVQECKDGIYPCEDNSNHQAQLLKVDKFDVMLGIH